MGGGGGRELKRVGWRKRGKYPGEAQTGCVSNMYDIWRLECR